LSELHVSALTAHLENGYVTTSTYNLAHDSCSFFRRSSIALLGLIYVFYTVPLTLASQLVDPQALEKIVPGAAELAAEKGIQITLLLSGLITAMIWSSFFAVCPVMFKVRFLLSCDCPFMLSK
jgi:hypothetical protein